MFTGIVNGIGQVKNIEKLSELHRLRIAFPSNALINLERGASIAINGCCLTVTVFSIAESWAEFDVMKESLRITNLGSLEQGSTVNFERAAKFGDEIGGHLMSGHVSTTVRLIDRKESDTNCELVFSTDNTVKPYILPKGFVGLNGCSLTVGAEVSDQFSVFLIPETLAITTFGDAKVGDFINLEIDPQTQAIVDTVERYLKNK